jgi:hypothetical protein
MKSLLLFANMILVASIVNADEVKIRCDYKFMGMDTSSVVVTQNEAGEYSSYAEVIMQGKSHFESFTVDAAKDDELLRGWLSKESQQNSIEMVIYKEPQKLGRSKLTNHHVPIAKDMWGDCSETPL